jgi:hypothetical protein
MILLLFNKQAQRLGATHFQLQSAYTAPATAPFIRRFKPFY